MKVIKLRLVIKKQCKMVENVYRKAVHLKHMYY
jgi:hypothetical protein